MSKALAEDHGALNNSNTTARSFLIHNQLREKIGVSRFDRDHELRPAVQVYASIRIDAPADRDAEGFDRRIGQPRTRVKVVKEQGFSAPGKAGRVDNRYGKGHLAQGDSWTRGVEKSIIRKSGAWYTYEETVGQGKENSRNS